MRSARIHCAVLATGARMLRRTMKKLMRMINTTCTPMLNSK